MTVRLINIFFNRNSHIYRTLSSPVLKSYWLTSSFNFQKRHKSVNWSYTHRGGTAPLKSLTVGNIIDRAIDDFGDTEAVVNGTQGIRKTFTQFIDDINRFAAGLVALNLDVGDRFGIWSPNCYEWVVAQHAATKAGLIMVPISPANQIPEVDYCIRKVGMKAMVIYDKFRTQDYHQILTQMMPEINETKPGNIIKSKSYPHFERIITMTDKELSGTVKFNDVFEASNSEHWAKLEKIQSKITIDKPVYIMFTSGTTGKPKGVMLSHHNLVNASIIPTDNIETEKNKIRSCVVVPLFHGIGCFMISLFNLINGHATILTGPTYNTTLALKTIQEEKCTEIMAPPTIFFDLVNHPDSVKTDFSSLTRLMMGASLCPPALLSKLEKEWNCKNVITLYGSTEVCGTATCSQVDDPRDERLYTSGRPHQFLEVKIVDTQGNLLPRGQAGEICVRGHKVMLGYWGDEEKTREAITVNGWYHSGDVGIMLENGCLQIVDRIRDMIIRGGQNIYPKEIEDCLIQHPKILEAYVIGVPDERMGEEVCAWVQCKSGDTLTDNELKEFCKGKLAHYKIPRYVRHVQQFPKTLSGKVQKHVMREEESKFKR